MVLCISRDQHNEARGVGLLCAGIAQLFQQGDLLVTRQQTRVDQQDGRMGSEQRLFHGRHGAAYQGLQAAPIGALGGGGIGL